MAERRDTSELEIQLKEKGQEAGLTQMRDKIGTNYETVCLSDREGINARTVNECKGNFFSCGLCPCG